MGALLRSVLGFVALAAQGATESRAHFHIVLPRTPAAKRGQSIELSYRWGHPFEHQLFDAEPPRQWFVLTPDGAKIDLLALSEKVRDVPQAGAHRVSFSPTVRGDYVCLVQCPLVWMEEDGEFLEDTVKVVVHVQAQKGWDAVAGLSFELVPLTRPYGLRAGMVFQAQALADGKPLPACLVEIERYNQTPPKELPPDEHITRTAKTDPNGIVTTTLPEPGWWCVTVQRSGGMKERSGKSYPVRQRSTIWVHVDPAPVAEVK